MCLRHGGCGADSSAPFRHVRGEETSDRGEACDLCILHAQELSMRTSENRTNRRPDPDPGSSLGVCHPVLRIWTAIKLLPEDQFGAKGINLPLLGKAWSGPRALFLIGLAAIVCGLVGTLVGMSLSDLLSIAMPRFFDQSIRLELLLYPWVMVLFLNACHSVSQRLDI